MYKCIKKVYLIKITYLIMSIKFFKRLIILFLGLVLQAQAEIFISYQFGEPEYAIKTTESAAKISNARDTDLNSRLKGNGQLVIDDILERQNEALLDNEDALMGVDGLVYLRADWSEWADTNVAQNFSIGVRTRDNISRANSSFMVTLKTGTSANQNLNLTMATGTSGTESFAWITDDILGASTQGLSLILGMDIKNDTFSVWYDVGITGNYTVAYKNQPITYASEVSAAKQVNAVILQSNSGTASLDKLVLATSQLEVGLNSEPATYLLFFGFSAIGWLVFQRPH